MQVATQNPYQEKNVAILKIQMLQSALCRGFLLLLIFGHFLLNAAFLSIQVMFALVEITFVSGNELSSATCKYYSWTFSVECDSYWNLHGFDLGIACDLLLKTRATCLIQMEKYNILTDPVWANRVSPFTSVGP